MRPNVVEVVTGQDLTPDRAETEPPLFNIPA